MICRLSIVAAVSFVAVAGCQRSVETLTLATTTSTRDSGLLERLLPSFESTSGLQVKVIAVGSGQALELGRRGDADVLLTHSPRAEAEFRTEGFAASQFSVMHNRFVLVGPAADPAQVKSVTGVVGAFEAIIAAGCMFVSRDDDSGTHHKELEIWQRVGSMPGIDKYLKTGSGMAASLRVASEKRAYILTDEATFLAQAHRLELAIHSSPEKLLSNPYTVTVVSPKVHGEVNQEGAERFARFLLSAEAQDLIRSFRAAGSNEPLFVPADGNDD